MDNSGEKGSKNIVRRFSLVRRLKAPRTHPLAQSPTFPSPFTMTNSNPTTPPFTTTGDTTTLSPSYSLPIGLVLLSVPLLLIQPWVSAVIAVFGVFLLYQAVSLRLVFTATALDIYRGETLVRRFPYAEWQNWRIFWQPVPILFYFKEVKSIHFLPILFSPKGLKGVLEQRQLPRR